MAGRQDHVGQSDNLNQLAHSQLTGHQHRSQCFVNDTVGIPERCTQATSKLGTNVGGDPNCGWVLLVVSASNSRAPSAGSWCALAPSLSPADLGLPSCHSAIHWPERSATAKPPELIKPKEQHSDVAQSGTCIPARATQGKQFLHMVLASSRTKITR